MSAVLFAGPTLAEADLSLPADWIVQPPAGQGDIFRAARRFRPEAIGLVDGYFEGVPSVWHKEILWAMSEGIAVYGSASMGALRAAELCDLGMIGVGTVFEGYRDGVLVADDEVAVLHGPEETGFIVLTEPLVNVRATCGAARAQGILTVGEAETALKAAGRIFYKDRTWREIMEQARRCGLAEPSLDRFEAWLKAGRVDQKRLDALLMVDRMLDELEHRTCDRAPLAFQTTFLWDRAIVGWDRRDAATLRRPGDHDAVLDELRLDPDEYLALKARAICWMAACGEGQVAPADVSRGDRIAAMHRHRQAHRLFRAVDLDRWLAAQELDRDRYEELMLDQAALDDAMSSETPELHRRMIDILKLDGSFSAAAERSKAKGHFLAQIESTSAIPRQPTPPALIDWFFRDTLCRPIPDDIETFASQLGIPSRQAFYGLLAAEFLYSAGNQGASAP